jgi:hypothetical protein
MPWLTLKFFPGFCPDHTTWTIELESDGSFSQKVELCRPVRRSNRDDQRVLVYTGHLSAGHMETLRSLIEEIDFEGLNSFDAYPCVTDVSDQRIVVEDQAGTRSFEGPIFLYLDEQKIIEGRPEVFGHPLPDHLTLQELTDLWTFVHDLCPFPPDEERDSPRQTRALPLPTMELEVRKPEIPEFLRTQPRPQVPVTYDEIKLRLGAALVEAREYLAKRVVHSCPEKSKFQVLEYFWPPDDGNPSCEVEHLRALTSDGLSLEQAVRVLNRDGTISGIEVVPTRVSETATHYKLLRHQGKAKTVAARNSDQECHPFRLYTGPIIGNDPEVCLGGAPFSLDEEQFWTFFDGRWSSRSPSVL